jgi:hypothetical protein
MIKGLDAGKLGSLEARRLGRFEAVKYSSKPISHLSGLSAPLSSWV